MSIKLVTDGSVDVPTEIVEEYDIPVVPPIVIIEGKEYLSGVDISLEEFFRLQRTAATLPQTSQPAPGQFVEAFEAALQTHAQVLYIGVSSGLSGTFNSARQAAGTFPEGKIVLHDSLTISGEAGMQVIAAARALNQGASMEAALAAVRKAQQETKFYFVLDELTYLIKGGRIGRVAGAVGSVLNLKPIITVDKRDGKFAPHSRIRSFKAALKKAVQLAADIVGEGKPARFMVVYGDMRAEADALSEELRQRFDVRWLTITTAAPTLAAHTGPQALGLVVAPGDWAD